MGIFEKIVNQQGWTLINGPIQLTGGFMHKMYKLETTQGIYAIKLLNPFIIQRDGAMDNFKQAEKLENILEKYHISMLPALILNGQKMQKVDNQYYYVYDFYDGKAIKGKEIHRHHCFKIGELLSTIHQIDMKKETQEYIEMNIDWNFYLKQLKNVNQELYTSLKENYDVIIQLQNKGNLARKKLSPILAICHNDMDSKNVLWKDDDYRIIDLECLSYNHPYMELLELALSWSGYEECDIDFNLFKSFLQGYKNISQYLPSNWEVLYDSNIERLEWLEYNLKRSLGIECSEDEKEIGVAQVKETIKLICYYDKVKEEVLTCCEIMNT